MTLVLDGRRIERVQIIDDDPTAREAYTYAIEELNLQPVPVVGPLYDLEEFVQTLEIRADAVICDHHLQMSAYAHFSGAHTASRLYDQRIPAILYTRYEDIIHDIRPYRRKIPVLLNPDEVDLETLAGGFRQCIEEFLGRFRPSRKAWRALVRVEDIDVERKLIYVVVPGWDPGKVFPLPYQAVPEEIQNRLGQQRRFHAQVNIGAAEHEELFFEDWELE